VWQTPLGQIAVFINIAEQDGQDTAWLWDPIAAQPEKLAGRARNSSDVDLAGFCHYAPDSLVAIALRDIQGNHWDLVPDSRPLVGVIPIANRAIEVGREDIASGIITKLLRRANWQDFPAVGRAFANVGWLLKNAKTGDKTLVPSFLDALCNNKWLGWQFSKSHCGTLATGLRLLTLYQPPKVYQRFSNPSLGIRIGNELAGFPQADPAQRALVIQLLGCASLFGWQVNRGWLQNISLEAISQLPMGILPHSPEASKVEDWQFQLWLGLRSVTSITGKSLEVPPELIVQTLNLWRTNLAESSLTPHPAEHRINQEMVRWLEVCTQSDNGLLLPPAKPLYAIL
jgi:hypothetical protein